MLSGILERIDSHCEIVKRILSLTTLTVVSADD